MSIAGGFALRELGKASYGSITEDYLNFATSTNAQLTPHTSLGAIHNAIASAISALTPKSVSNIPFLYSDHEAIDFQIWAEENDFSVFRTFVCEFDNWLPIGLYNDAYNRREVELSIIVAYPHMWDLYKKQDTPLVSNKASMLKIIEEDMDQIVSIAGYQGASNWPDGSWPKVPQEVEIQHGEGTSFGVLTVTCEYWYK